MSPNLLGFEMYKQASAILKGKEANVGGLESPYLSQHSKRATVFLFHSLQKEEISSWAEPQILPSPHAHRD